jgi:hypothetical protein
MPQKPNITKGTNTGCQPLTTKITKATATITQNLNGMGKTFSFGSSNRILY